MRAKRAKAQSQSLANRLAGVSVLGQQLAMLGYIYGVDIEESLATILSPEAGKE